MFRVEAGSTNKYCDGVSRRSFVQIGVAGMASVGLADVLRATEESPVDGAAGMLTSRGGPNGGSTAGKYPSIGSIAAKMCGPRESSMPAYVSVPYASSIGLRPGYFGANYLGLEHCAANSAGRRG